MRRESSTSPRQVAARAREVEAVALRLQGCSYSTIAERLGTTKSVAHAAVARSLERTASTLQETADALREIELARLDALLLGVWVRATSGDVPSVGAAIRIAERRAKLLGLDAPVRREVSGPDGSPLVPATTADLTRLSDADLATLDAILSRALPA